MLTEIPKYTNRHGEPVSPACYEGQHENCTETLETCRCTYRGNHTTMHAYASSPVGKKSAPAETLEQQAQEWWDAERFESPSHSTNILKEYEEWLLTRWTKFARQVREETVRECLDIADMCRMLDAKGAGASGTIKRIRDHFGVKE